MNKKYQSEALMVSHQAAQNLFELGMIDAAEMREFDKDCLVPNIHHPPPPQKKMPSCLCQQSPTGVNRQYHDRTKKHAYLIMAHSELAILKLLLEDLDDIRNDIFLHFDKKQKGFPREELKEIVKTSNLYFVERINVNWGGYSQIQAEMILLSEAISKGTYFYYHLITGQTFPLKNQEFIHSFFNKHYGYEFIGFCNKDEKYLDRVRFFYLFGEMGKSISLIKKGKNILRRICIKIQKRMGFSRIKHINMVFKKGFAYWSITHDLAFYIINSPSREKIYKNTYCCDEVFLHTLVYNSPFFNKVYDKNDEWKGCLFITQWDKNSDLNFHHEDQDKLLSADALFACKFMGEEGVELITTIKRQRI
jgi:hypothetical protein